jgi:hypothetical protein
LEANRSQEFHSDLISICNGSETYRYKATKGRQHYHDCLVTYLKEQLGDGLLSADTEDDGEYRVLTISVSDSAKDRLLAEDDTVAAEDDTVAVEDYLE